MDVFAPFTCFASSLETHVGSVSHQNFNSLCFAVCLFENKSMQHTSTDQNHPKYEYIFVLSLHGVFTFTFSHLSSSEVLPSITITKPKPMGFPLSMSFQKARAHQCSRLFPSSLAQWDCRSHDMYSSDDFNHHLDDTSWLQ